MFLFLNNIRVSLKLLASELRSESESKFLVSSRALFAKIFGLILALGSCLSIGSEGPLVHTASCLAYFVLRHVPEFETLLLHPNYLRQIYAASTAVGVSSTFNAPVGGVLFSIEVTSTYYLVSNYWRSFIAAVAGIISCNLFLLSQSDPLIVLKMAPLPHQFQKWELILFAFMAVALGWAAHWFLKMHQVFNQAIRPLNIARPLVSVVLVGIVTAFLVYVTGAYNSKSVSVLNLVSDVLNNGVVVEMQSMMSSAIGGLIVSALVRTFLTLLGTNIPIPAGIFMPVFLIGGLWGRCFGHIIQNIAIANGTGDSIVLSSYALVGATAFCAGVTHTISAAIIAVELTGNLQMIMPCLLVAVIAAGITTHNGLSVYDQGMLNKGLQSLQLLLKFTTSFRHARNVMDGEGEYACVPQTASAAQLLHILETSDLDIFPVVAYAPVINPSSMPTDTGAEAEAAISPNIADNTNSGTISSSSDGNAETHDADLLGGINSSSSAEPKLTTTRNLVGTVSRRQLYLHLLSMFGDSNVDQHPKEDEGYSDDDEYDEQKEEEDYLRTHLTRAHSAITGALYGPVDSPSSAPPLDDTTPGGPNQQPSTPSDLLRRLLPQDARDEDLVVRKERMRRRVFAQRRRWQRTVHRWLLLPEQYFFGDTTANTAPATSGQPTVTRDERLGNVHVHETSVNPLLRTSSLHSDDDVPTISSRRSAQLGRVSSLVLAPTPTMTQRARYWLQRAARFMLKTDHEDPVVYPSEAERSALHSQIPEAVLARLDMPVDLLNDPTFHVNLCPFR